jgi:hypothetical protein
MTYEQNGSVDLGDHPREVVPVTPAQAPQRIRRDQHWHALADELVVQTTKARCVSERAVNENDGGISHSNYPLKSGIGVLKRVLLLPTARVGPDSLEKSAPSNGEGL